MKQLFLFLFFSLTIMGQKQEKEIDSVSYALGVVSSKEVKRLRSGLKKGFGLTLNEHAYMLGIKNGIDSKNLKIPIERSRKLSIEFFNKQRELAKKRKKENIFPIDSPISSDATLNTSLDSISYALGVKNGNKIVLMKSKIKKEFDLDLNIETLKTGYVNGVDSLNVKISSLVSDNKIKSFFKKLQDNIALKNKKKGEDFLKKNKNKKGVKTTKSGLQYIVINEGIGKRPIATSIVKVHYHGTLIDGTVFDSSDTNESAEFLLNTVILGWIEGLQLMKEGGKYRFFIPNELAYAKNTLKLIKPYSVLIFDIELLEVK